jgi:hypothetical protein
MTSRRQLEANRANAKASTGPRSVRGKARASQNALCHGLSLPIHLQPVLSAEAENLTRKIAGEGTDAPDILDCACRVAEAQIDLRRVRAARLGLLERYLSNPKYKPVRNLHQRIRALARLGRMMGRMTPQEISDPTFQKYASDIVGKPPQGAEKFVYILADFTKALNAMDRYERRALSRRKFAIRELDALRRQTAT